MSDMRLGDMKITCSRRKPAESLYKIADLRASWTFISTTDSLHPFHNNCSSLRITFSNPLLSYHHGRPQQSCLCGRSDQACRGQGRRGMHSLNSIQSIALKTPSFWKAWPSSRAPLKSMSQDACHTSTFSARRTMKSRSLRCKIELRNGRIICVLADTFDSYKDAAAAQAHKETAHFADAMKEGMSGKLAAPPKIQVVERKGGFRRG